MFESSSSKKRANNTGYLVRPRLGALRSLYNSRPFNENRKKIRKSASPKMEFRRKPDYADTAYKEAVSRLRVLLAESYVPIKRPLRELDSGGEETDNQSLISTVSRTSKPYYTTGRYYYPQFKKNFLFPQEKLSQTAQNTPSNPPPELMAFIERQEDYIEQLEKESTFCRSELSTLLSKVKDVISENENLHEKQKNKLIKSVFEQLDTETEDEIEDKKPLKKLLIQGPSIVFESRISELEAQLTQAKIDLRKALEDKTIPDSTELEKLRKDKETLQETNSKLEHDLSKLKSKEHETCDQVKRSLDVAERAQYEKTEAEHEIRRLKDELDRQHHKIRETISEQSRRLSEERNQIERRYTQQIEQLTAELGVQWETSNKIQLELEKQRRENGDLRRENTQKQALIEELKKDMLNKIVTLQSDIGASGAEKSALEQQISSLNLTNERLERQGKQEIVRLQAEMQSLRQRLDRADSDLIHSRRENIRLNEQISGLEKEINLNAAINEERNKTSSKIVALPAPSDVAKQPEELSSKIHDIESKHAATVAELEGMIQSQNQLMDKLSEECHTLTRKLDDSSHRHKEEIRDLQTSLDHLNHRFSAQIQATTPLPKDEVSPVTQQPEQQKQEEEKYYSEEAPRQQEYYSEDPAGQQQYDQYMTQEQYDQMYPQQEGEAPQYQEQPQQEYDPNSTEYQTQEEVPSQET